MIRYRPKKRKNPKPFRIPSHAARTAAARNSRTAIPLYDPADDVRPAEPLFFVRDRVQILLRCGGKEPLILNKADAAVQNEKICGHQQNRRKDCHRHSDPGLLNVCLYYHRTGLRARNKGLRRRHRTAGGQARGQWEDDRRRACGTRTPAKAAATRNSGRPNRLKQRKIDKRKTLKTDVFKVFLARKERFELSRAF